MAVSCQSLPYGNVSPDMQSSVTAVQAARMCIKEVIKEMSSEELSQVVKRKH